MSLAQPQLSLPFFSFGENANTSELQRLCPQRDYRACFVRATKAHYHVADIQFNRPRTQPPAAAATKSFPACSKPAVEAPPSLSDAATQLPTPSRGESFVVSALRGHQPVPPSVVLPTGDRLSLLAARLSAAASSRPASASSPLGCDSPASAIDARALLLIGLPSAAGKKGASYRRREARRTWLSHPAMGDRVVACFLVSALEPEAHVDAVEREAIKHGDVLLLQAPETAMIVRNPTAYSNFSRAGRGMPTFKQYAFFRHAARMLRSVPYVAKVDDDSIVGLDALLPLLDALRCHRYALLGAINWAGFIPRATAPGIMGDRCAFAWSRFEALTNFGRPTGEPGQSWHQVLARPALPPCRAARMAPLPRSSARLAPRLFAPQAACDTLGSVLPFPFAAGAGYVLSGALLRWVGTSPLVARWVEEAGGEGREALQWQKYEDTSLGYWLTYAPSAVEYVNLQRCVLSPTPEREGGCRARGRRCLPAGVADGSAPCRPQLGAQFHVPRAWISVVQGGRVPTPIQPAHTHRARLEAHGLPIRLAPDARRGGRLRALRLRARPPAQRPRKAERRLSLN